MSHISNIQSSSQDKPSPKTPIGEQGNNPKGKDQDNPTDGERSSDPLPPGWTEVQSRTHNRTFYFHQETSKTSWTRPGVGSSQESTPSSKPTLDRRDSAIKDKSGRDLAGDGDKPKPTVGNPSTNESEANQNHVASAYASRRGGRPGQPGQVPPIPMRPRADIDRRRPRSPSPGRGGRGRDDDSKRFKMDDGRRSPPLSARLAAMDRRTFSSLLPWDVVCQFRTWCVSNDLVCVTSST